MPHSLSGLLLGAGFSCEAGMPLVWELTDELRRWLTPEKFRSLNDHWRQQGEGFSDAVMDDICQVLTRPDMHYEALLGYVEAQYRRPSPDHVQQQYHHAYSWLVETVYYVLHLRHVTNASKIEQWLRLLDGIAVLTEHNAPLWVFSLNHDLLVEALAARHGIPLNCGFPDGLVRLPRRDAVGAKIGELMAEVVLQDHIDTGQRGYFDVGKVGINLLKIHGSLDVFAFRDGKDLLRVLPDDPSVTAIFEALRVTNEELIYVDRKYPDRRVKPTNEILYADENGEMQFLRRTLLSGAYKFDPHRSQVLPRPVLDHFRHNLNQISDLICIGYSFGDLHINTVIRQWLEWGSNRRVRVVDPGATSIPAALLHLAPQIDLHTEKAVDYLDRIAGITRTRLDGIQRRFTAWARKQPAEQGQAQFAAFQREYMQSILHRIVERIASEGEAGLRAHAGPPEEYAKRLYAEVGGMPEDVFEAFLDSLDPAKRKPGHQEIAEAAYLRWVERGRPDGGDVEDWLVAEAALRSANGTPP